MEYYSLFSVMMLLMVTFVVAGMVGKTTAKAVLTTAIIAAISIPTWFVLPWFAPWVAVGLMAWVVVILLEKPGPVAGFLLFVGQIPVIGYAVSSFIGGSEAFVPSLIAIIDLILSGLSLVLISNKSKNEGR